MTDWMDIGALEEVPVLGARLVKTQAGCVAIFRTELNEVFAIDNTCPHKGGPLADGIVHGRAVTCPLHNYVISLETGEAQGADEGSVNTYAARVENGRILLDVARLRGRAAA